MKVKLQLNGNTPLTIDESYNYNMTMTDCETEILMDISTSGDLIKLDELCNEIIGTTKYFNYSIVKI